MIIFTFLNMKIDFIYLVCKKKKGQLKKYHCKMICLMLNIWRIKKKLTFLIFSKMNLSYINTLYNKWCKTSFLKLVCIHVVDDSISINLFQSHLSRISFTEKIFSSHFNIQRASLQNIISQELFLMAQRGEMAFGNELAL